MQFNDIVTAYKGIQEGYAKDGRGAKDVRATVFMNFHPVSITNNVSAYNPYCRCLNYQSFSAHSPTTKQSPFLSFHFFTHFFYYNYALMKK